MESEEGKKAREEDLQFQMDLETTQKLSLKMAVKGKQVMEKGAEAIKVLDWLCQGRKHQSVEGVVILKIGASMHDAKARVH